VISFRRAGLSALSLIISGLAPFGVAQGQNTASQPGTTNAVSLATWNVAKHDSADDIETTLPSVVVSGAPRSFQVVSIPIPDAFARVMKLELEMIPHGDFVVLGPRTRSLPSSSRRQVGVTIGIPASGLAGRIVARVVTAGELR